MDILREAFSQTRRTGAVVILVIVLVAVWIIVRQPLGPGRTFLMVALAAAPIITAYSIHAGLALLLAVACMDGLLKAWYGQNLISLLLKDYLLALCAIVWLSGRPWRYRRPPQVRGVLAAMTALSVWVGFELFNPASSGGVVPGKAAIAGARAWVIWLPLFVIAFDVIVTPRDVRRLALWVAILGCVVGLYGISQHFLGYDWLGAMTGSVSEKAAQYGWYSETGERLPRIFGTTVSPHTMATLMAMAIFIGGGLVVRMSAWQRLAWTPALIACGAALLLSGTRTALVSLIGAVAALVIVRRRLSLLVWLLLLTGAAVVVTGHLTGGEIYERFESLWKQRDYTVQRPLYPMQKAVGYAWRYPLGRGVAMGVGVPLSWRGQVATAGEFYENDFARALAELGWPGLALYGWLLWQVGVLIAWSWRETRGTEYELLALGLGAAVVVVVVSTLVGAALYLAPGALLMWAAAAGLARLAVACAARRAAFERLADELAARKEPAPALQT